MPGLLAISAGTTRSQWLRAMASGDRAAATAALDTGHCLRARPTLIPEVVRIIAQLESDGFATPAPRPGTGPGTATAMVLGSGGA